MWSREPPTALPSANSVTLRRRLLVRLSVSVLAVYLVISVTFLVVVWAPDTNLRGMLGTAAFSGASVEQLERMQATYLEARGRDRPLFDRYVAWLVDVTLFRWGLSPSQGAPVTEVISAAVGRTAAYLVPGALGAWVLGTGIGLRSARDHGSSVDQAGRLGSYLLLGLPSFWLATLCLALFAAPTVDGGIGSAGETFAWTVVAPAGVLAAGLLASQVSLTRSHSVEQFGAAYVDFLRAKGLSERAVSRRVLRNVLVPVLSLTAAELFSVLVLGVVVIETVFAIQGIGWLTIVAAQENDIPLILGTTMVLISVGVGGSLLADVAGAWLDPRNESI